MIIERLRSKPQRRRTATIKVMVLVCKLPGCYFDRRLLQLSELYLNGEELAGRGDGWGKLEEGYGA